MASSRNTEFKTISFEAYGCEGSKGAYPEIPQQGILSVVRSCEDVHQKGVLSCKHEGFHEFVDEGKGMDFGTKQISGFIGNLPRYIPIPDRQSSSLPLRLSGYPVLGVRPFEMFPSSLRYEDKNLLYRELPPIDTQYTKRTLFQGKRLIFFGSGPDVLIEGLNRDKDEIGLYPALASAGFTATVTPDFSVNEGSCYLGQIANLNRGLAMGELAEHEGVPAIPNIFAIDDYQRGLWVHFLNENPSIQIVSINCQRQRRRYADMEVVWETITYLMEQTESPIHIILRGYPLAPWSMQPIFGYLSRLHFADSAPFFLPRNHHFSEFSRAEHKLVKKYHKPADAIERARMIESSLAAREEFLDFICGGGVMGVESPVHVAHHVHNKHH